MTTPSSSTKVTYSSASVDMSELHRRFDAALADVKARLGKEYPLYIDGQPVSSPLPPVVDLMPADTSVVLGKFASASAALVEKAIAGAKAVHPAAGAAAFTRRNGAEEALRFREGLRPCPLSIC